MTLRDYWDEAEYNNWIYNGSYMNMNTMKFWMCMQVAFLSYDEKLWLRWIWIYIKLNLVISFIIKIIKTKIDDDEFDMHVDNNIQIKYII